MTKRTLFLDPSMGIAAGMAFAMAARHRIPKATVTHPTGVIVPGDPFMTEKLREPDYVPYCGPCDPMQRVRRTSFGFECPRCGNKMNYDLTHYDGNASVQYEGPAPVQPISQWNDAVEAKKQAKLAAKGASMTRLAATEAERSLTERQKDMEVAAQKHNAERTPKFGDLMRNPWAGEGNPTRDGYFVRSKRVTGRFNPGLWYEMTDRLGKFWEINGKVAMFIDEPARASQQSAAQATAEPVACTSCDGKGGWVAAEWTDPVSGPECEVERCGDCEGTGKLAADYLPLVAAPDRAPRTDSAALVRVARVLADRSADACGVDREDNWKFYSDDFMADAQAAIAASMPQKGADHE